MATVVPCGTTFSEKFFLVYAVIFWALGSGPKGLWWVYSKFLFRGLETRGRVSRTLSKSSPKLF